MPINYRKRRIVHGPSKSELRAARNERAELQKTRTGTLNQRFPTVNHLQIDLRLESPTGNTLDQFSRMTTADEPLKLDVQCPSTCGGGSFSLVEAVENTVQAAKESQEGMSICQTASYADSRLPCGTKLYYRISIQYKGE
jgi:hypothetical protein